MTTADTVTMSRSTRSMALHISLWIAQLLLALLFGGAGSAKVFTPLPDLAVSLPYTTDLPGWLVRFIGVSEIAGAIGLVLPALTRTATTLTPLAAAGVCAVMLLATFFHLFRSEFSAMPMTIVIGAVAAFIAWGRLSKVPISARQRPG
jgi:putative oxidoreductase